MCSRLQWNWMIGVGRSLRPDSSMKTISRRSAEQDAGGRQNPSKEHGNYRLNRFATLPPPIRIKPADAENQRPPKGPMRQPCVRLQSADDGRGGGS
jgi:hypothetical protein